MSNMRVGSFVRKALLWGIVCEAFGVLTHQLCVLVTYWCHMRQLRFWRDNLAVDGRQMASLVAVHSRGSLFDVYGLLHCLLAPD